MISAADDGNGGALPVGAQHTRHTPNGLGDDRDGHEFQTVDQANTDRSAECGRAIGKEHERDGGRQREAGPCREAAQIAGPHEADGKSDLAAGRAGQELAEPDEICIGVLVEPAAAHDELLPEISDVRDRPAEAGEAQLQEDEENFDWRASPLSLAAAGCVTIVIKPCFSLRRS